MKFREYMARFDAAATPEHAIERGFYVERLGRSVADEIAARIELRPTSTHLLVGGVGSGKTTQILVAHKRLGKVADLVAIYCDVSARHDIGRLVPGVLVAIAGLEISNIPDMEEDQEVFRARQFFKHLADGYVEDESDWHERLSEKHIRDAYQKGVLSPSRPLSEHNSEYWLLSHAPDRLVDLSRSVETRGRHIVVLFDSLDRVGDAALFERVVQQDVAALRQADIGVVLVGPLRSMYGTDRTIVDRFDYFYYQPCVDAQQDAAGLDFLLRVLRARAATDILPDASCRRLAEYSGGVLRDLISLAQAAGEEAYLAGTDTITEAHVETAADAFGRKHLLGLGPDELEGLQRVRTKGIFVQTSDKDLALLVTRRVLEYQNGRPRYAVHPTIRPLLEQLAEKP